MAGAAKVSGERVGVDRETGKLLTGFAHCLQSLLVIFTTRINTRLMRLSFGSDIPALVDRPQARETFARLYNAMTQAVLDWEPGFRIRYFNVVDASPEGAATIELTGVYYPRGHLGDYSVAEDATMRFTMSITNTGMILTGSPV